MSSWSRWCDNGSRESYRQVYVKHGEVGVRGLGSESRGQEFSWGIESARETIL